MTDASSMPIDRTTPLRAYAAAQKRETVQRLQRAITRLEAEGRPVNTFTIKEVSGLDYMAYYRNKEAYALFREHSSHLRRKRMREHESEPGSPRPPARELAERGGLPGVVEVPPRALAQKDKRMRPVRQVRRVRSGRDEITVRAQADYAELERRYHKLLQEHMQCGLKIARLEAQLAEHVAFMDRYRTALQHDEHNPEN